MRTHRGRRRSASSAPSSSPGTARSATARVERASSTSRRRTSPARSWRRGRGCKAWGRWRRLLPAHRAHAAGAARRPARAQPGPPTGTDRRAIAYVGSLGGPRCRSRTPSGATSAEGQQALHRALRRLPPGRRRGRRRHGRGAPALTTRRRHRSPRPCAIGPYVMPRFSTRAITDGELDSIIALRPVREDAERPGGWSLGHVGPIPEGLVAWLIAAARARRSSASSGRRR